MKDSNLTQQQKEAKLQSYYVQKTQNRPLMNVYSGIKNTTAKKLEDFFKDNGGRNPNKQKLREFLTTMNWLHIPMPSRFNFTVSGSSFYSNCKINFVFADSGHVEQFPTRFDALLVQTLERMETVHSQL